MDKLTGGKWKANRGQMGGGCVDQRTEGKREADGQTWGGREADEWMGG